MPRLNSHSRNVLQLLSWPSCLALILCCNHLLCQAPVALASDELPGGGQATPVDSIALPAGFRAQLLRSAAQGEDSWISLTFDDAGRVLVGRDTRGVARMTLNEDRSRVERFEVVEDTLKHCRGVLWAHDSLYICATDSKGVYRLRDSDADDSLDSLQLLKSMDYQSRFGHGTNQVVLGPDKMVYIVNGNDVAIPEGVSLESPYRDARDDHLLPEPRDAVAEVRVGHILRTDAQGAQWEVLAGGLRNPFDLAFNRHGEMFTYDADMEWDVGLPWYRPTRLNHIVSGGEYGWRWGTGKWPSYFADSLPATLETGLGSPTGLEFGTCSAFPPQYRDALFMGDWQNGRILTVDMTPRGASYDCEYGVFLEGGALNVCDLSFGPDGALYFITGGRGSQSGLYRVTYEGGAEAAELSSGDPLSTAEEDNQAAKASAARLVRRELAEYHQRRDASAIDKVWPYLDSSDRWLRATARLALERQEPELWRQRALAETRPTASIAALLALVRLGQAQDQPEVLNSLEQLPLEPLDSEQLLELLRVYQLSFIRQGVPAPADRQRVLSRLEPLYPQPSSYANRELCRLLIYLKSPQAIPQTVELMRTALSQEDAIFYAQLLARIDEGWTRETRESFFDSLLVARGYQGGHLLSDTLAHIREDALAHLSQADREHLQTRIEKLLAPAEASAVATAAPLVQQWNLEQLEAELSQAGHEPSWQAGRAALAKAACITCHRVGEQGNSTGPDLTHVGKRFDQRALLESIVEPSKVIDEKYRLQRYLLASGEVVTGRPVSVSASTLTIQTESLPSQTVQIQRAEIEQTSPAQLSPMPAGLLNVLTLDEILDLLAYLKQPTSLDAP